MGCSLTKITSPADIPNSRVARERQSSLQPSALDGVLGPLSYVGKAISDSRSAADVGVSLAFLRAFADRVGPAVTTADVVGRYVVPETVAHKCRYIDAMPQAHVGRPNFFVSHKWSSPFRELVAGVDAYVQAHPAYSTVDPTATYLWVDIFIINQHSDQKQQQEHLGNLHQAIDACTSTLLLLDQKGLVLTRIWCLYEVWNTLLLGGPQRLLVLSSSVDYGALKDIYYELDVSKAQATVEADKHRFLADIQASMGHEEMGQQVREALVSSALAQAQNAAASGRFDPDWHLQAQAKCGRMLMLRGDHNTARAYLLQSLQLSTELHGELSPQTSYRLLDMACLLSDLGQYDEAEEMYRKALRLQEAAFGADGEGLMETVYSYGVLLREMGRFAESVAVLERALALQQRRLGPQHLATLQTLVQLATVQERCGSRDVAEDLHKQALQGMERALGPDHVDVSRCCNNLAALYSSQKRFGEAEALLYRAIAIRQRVLGATHPHTLNTRLNIAICMKAAGKLAEAMEMYEQVLAGREHALGPQHQDVAQVLNNIGNLHRVLGNRSAAEAAYCRALAIRQAALGPQHPDTANVMYNMGCLLMEDMDTRLPEAEQLFRQAAEVRVTAYGPRSEDALEASEKLVTALQNQGKNAAALEMYRQLYEAQLDSGAADAAQRVLGSWCELLEGLGKVSEVEQLRGRHAKSSVTDN